MYNIYIYTWIICAKLWIYILLHYIVARVLCPSCIAQPGFEMVVMWQPVRNITWDVSSGNWSYGRSSVVFAVEIIKLHSHVPQPWSFNGRMVAANTERGLMLPMISSLSREIKGRAGVQNASQRGFMIPADARELFSRFSNNHCHFKSHRVINGKWCFLEGGKALKTWIRCSPQRPKQAHWDPQWLDYRYSSELLTPALDGFIETKTTYCKWLQGQLMVIYT